MKVLITGSTGMIGGAITDLCIASEKITSIISLTRKAVKEIVKSLLSYLWAVNGTIKKSKNILVILI